MIQSAFLFYSDSVTSSIPLLFSLCFDSDMPFELLKLLFQLHKLNVSQTIHNSYNSTSCSDSYCSIVIDPFLWIFFSRNLLFYKRFFLLTFPFAVRFISVSSIHQNSWRFFPSFHSDDWIGQWLVIKSRFLVWLLFSLQPDMDSNLK